MKPKLTLQEARDLIDRFHESCKNDHEPLIEEIATLQSSLIFLYAGYESVETSIDYIEERTKKNNMKGAGK